MKIQKSWRTWRTLRKLNKISNFICAKNSAKQKTLADILADLKTTKNRRVTITPPTPPRYQRAEKWIPANIRPRKALKRESARQIIDNTAEAFGIGLAVDGSDLVLEADRDIPDAIVANLKRHKAEILSLLRPDLTTAAGGH
jgi:hypothetical protein